MQKQVKPWLNIHGHMYDIECDFLAEKAEGKIVLEIGTHYGRSTSAIASSATFVVTVDTYLGDPQINAPSLEETRKNLSIFDNISLVVGDWRDEDIDPSMYDMIFYDGCHTEEGEFLALLTNYKGIIAVHDYKPGEVGMAHVVEAVDAYAALTQRKRLKGAGSIAWFDAL